MKQIFLTKGRVALIDDTDFNSVFRYRWYFNARRGRVVGMVDGKIVYLSRFLMSEPVGMEVDHRDGDKLNHQRSNLRVCTSSENKYNIGIRRNNSTGYKGVARFRDKFQAYINVDGRRLHLGHFDDALLAAHAYNDAAREHHGEFAKFNEVAN